MPPSSSSKRQTAVRLRISQGINGEVSIESFRNARSVGVDSYLPGFASNSRLDGSTEKNQYLEEPEFDPQEIFEDLASENEENIEESFQYDVDGDSLKNIEELDVMNDLPRNFYSTFRIENSGDRKDRDKTTGGNLKGPNDGLNKDANGITKYPVSCASIRRSNYQKSIDSQFETLYSQYKDSKIGQILNEDFDSRDQVIFKDPEYIESNRQGFADAITDIKNSNFSDDQVAIKCTIDNFTADPLSAIPEDNEDGNLSSTSLLDDENDSEDQDKTHFDSQSIHENYRNLLFRPKNIEIKRQHAKSTTKSTSAVKSPKLETQKKLLLNTNDAHIKPNSILYKKCDNKSDNYDRKHILKQIKRENRVNKKVVASKFKASELLHKQNMFAVNQNIRQFKL
ncbi:MAG: hypothetical protein MHMPM18_001181 [Marteilia pararefringens]